MQSSGREIACLHFILSFFFFSTKTWSLSPWVLRSGLGFDSASFQRSFNLSTLLLNSVIFPEFLKNGEEDYCFFILLWVNSNTPTPL